MPARTTPSTSTIFNTRQLTSSVCLGWRCTRSRWQPFSTSTSHRSSGDDNKDVTQEPGAMSRRLTELSEESLEIGGRSARKAVQEAGFDEELKARLEERIASANFKSDNAGAFATANLPAAADKRSADIAMAEPWTGTEAVQDAAFRMLNDAHKPLRGPRAPARPMSVRGPPKAIDTGRPANKATGKRLANARDKSSIYSYLKDSSLSEEERDKYRKELKERFAPTARAIPATIQGLQSLANERIEDAIARGQFKNLPRGKNIERDYNASNPFLNTTEYFMNKIIQKQEIVPPWIEKQQELTATLARFRAQLRANWRRHVARSIASKGGSLPEQMRLAEQYAVAEAYEMKTRKALAYLSASDAGAENEQSPDAKGHDEALSDTTPVSIDEGSAPAESEQSTSNIADARPVVSPFRDPAWEATERSYQSLAVQNLNNLTRSYNLMAPDLAKKPYYSLPRELASCFADVAPQVAEAIRERALRPSSKGAEVIGHKPSGVLERFSIDSASHVHDERKPQYGFKEFWRDLFSKKT